MSVKKVSAAKNFDLLIGADPEFFLRDKKSGRIVSAHDIGKGTKQNPHRLVGGAMQIDGTAIEFNVDPSSSSVVFANRIGSVLEQIQGIVGPNYEFVFSPSVFYDQEYFDKVIPDSAKELGCNPDHDAYREGALNDPPKSVGTMRTGAGHLHFGWGTNFDKYDPDHIEDCCLLAQILDALFAPIEKFWDTDNDRRKMYGKPGCFRPTSYGMEYRSLSNAWLNGGRPLWINIFEVAAYGFRCAANGLQKTEIEAHIKAATDAMLHFRGNKTVRREDVRTLYIRLPPQYSSQDSGIPIVRYPAFPFELPDIR